MINNNYGDIVIVGDLQIKEEKPYSLAMMDFIEWFLKQSYCNSNNTLILLGDIVEKGWITSDESSLVLELFFKKLPFKTTYICHGNHEYNKGKSALKFLSNLPNVKVISTPELIDFNSKKFLFLPYIENKINDMSMKDYYSNLPDDLNQGDYVIGHFHYIPLFQKDKSFIDINKIKGRLILGHVHSGHLNLNKDHYLGSPLIDRYDHRHKESYIMTINSSGDWKEQFHLVPQFIDYQSVSYPNVLPEKKSTYVVWDIEDSINKDLSIEFYQKLCKELGYDFYYREVHKKIETSTTNNNNMTISSSGDNTEKGFKDYLNDFYIEKNISKNVQDILNKKLIKKLV